MRVEKKNFNHSRSLPTTRIEIANRFYFGSPIRSRANLLYCIWLVLGAIAHARPLCSPLCLRWGCLILVYLKCIYDDGCAAANERNRLIITDELQRKLHEMLIADNKKRYIRLGRALRIPFITSHTNTGFQANNVKWSFHFISNVFFFAM